MRRPGTAGTILAALGVAALAGTAHGTLFSFASDSNPNGFTFAGNGAAVTDSAGATPVVLLVDDNNGPLPALSYNVDFVADFTIAHVSSVQVAPGVFSHNYSLNGFFQFNTGAGPLLRATITDGAMVALGTATRWGSTETILGSDDPGSVEYTWFGPDLPAYGVFNGVSIGLDDAAFTLTNTQTFLGMGVSLNAQTFLPDAGWQSEGSFSGTAVFIPAPGAAALLGMAGLVVGRRRR